MKLWINKKEAVDEGCWSKWATGWNPSCLEPRGRAASSEQELWASGGVGMGLATPGTVGALGSAGRAGSHWGLLPGALTSRDPSVPLCPPTSHSGASGPESDSECSFLRAPEGSVDGWTRGAVFKGTWVRVRDTPRVPPVPAANSGTRGPCLPVPLALGPPGWPPALWSVTCLRR